MDDSIRRYYDSVMDLADPRLENYPMMGSPWPTLITTGLYLWVITSGLPRFMEKRKALDIRSFMIIYNFIMVLLSAYIFMEFALAGWFTGYSFGCQPVDYSKTERAVRMVNVCYMYYISKFIEFVDTVFFVLRKKDNQVTYLHLFHHCAMPLTWWAGVKFVPGGFGCFHGFVNSFVHIVMYTYYGLAACGPRFQKFLWWKKYITKLQITQFLLFCVHTSQLFFIECEYPMSFVYLILSVTVVNLALFLNFYRQAYNARAASHKTNGYNGTANGVTNGVMNGVTNGRSTYDKITDMKKLK